MSLNISIGPVRKKLDVKNLIVLGILSPMRLHVERSYAHYNVLNIYAWPVILLCEV